MRLTSSQTARNTISYIGCNLQGIIIVMMFPAMSLTAATLPFLSGGGGEITEILSNKLIPIDIRFAE